MLALNVPSCALALVQHTDTLSLSLCVCVCVRATQIHDAKVMNTKENLELGLDIEKIVWSRHARTQGIDMVC
jgi:hypothetical protein